ncbi:gastrula zinc finger protein XlCGF57.1-like [Colossoma macropomum]|uniref:gastrula zinc finger protein XlCGF57.1-like n=1 Tax=Colossoma macropomum TaxID=42526 RepID=UPI0018646F77|nr:gastrula zinc finger protein XlCGF57.1-like [Colossoma macropomum]
MLRSCFLQKQLHSLLDSLVKDIVNEICELDDVSVLKYVNGARPPGDDRPFSAKLLRVTTALERLTKGTVDQISQLFCRLSAGAQAKGHLSYLKRQKLKRKWISAETKLAKRSSVQPRSTGGQAQSVATDTTAPEERELSEEDLISQTEKVSGDIDPSCSSSEDTTLDKSAGPSSQTVEAASVQQKPVLKVELDHEKEQMKRSTQHHDQTEQMAHKQGESAQPLSKEENGVRPNCTQTNSADTLEIKISAQSLELNVGTKENSASRTQGTPPRAGKASAGTCKETSARKRIKCEACNKTFTYLNNLKRHQKTFHSGQTPHSCKDCGERFGSKRLLRVHLREHRVDKPHACTLCEKVFRLPNHLKKHMTSHTNERPFTCTTCGKTFALVSTLKAHERTHSGEKAFICTQCGMSFLTKSYLDYHQRVHTGEKPYTCIHCGKTFAQRSNLRVHERLHTGEKPFHCKDCGESFVHANSYKSHKQLHTGMKAFCCEHCGKGFRRGTHLKTHLLTHTGVKPFECDLCPKTFTLKGSLKAHRLTHTGEKSFVCNVCNKSFTQASSLGKHKRTHTGEKPYLCDFCNKSFCQSSHLHYHYRASHSGAKP